MAQAAPLQALRARIAALDPASRDATRSRLSLGDARLDAALGGGLTLGRWHELIGEGLERETGAAAAAFAATLCAPLARRGAVIWILRQDDLYAPGLWGLGFPSTRLIQVRVRRDAEALAALEESLASPGVAAALAEVDRIDLVAGRRLHLACATHGSTGFVVRRRPFGDARRLQDPKAGRDESEASPGAATRWRLAPAPSSPPSGSLLSGLPDEVASGLGPPRWRAVLDRAQGGRPGAWLVEHVDGAFPLRVVAELADRSRPSGRASGPGFGPGQSGEAFAAMPLRRAG